MPDFLTVEQTEALQALYEAEHLLCKAMHAVPSGDGPCLPAELLTLARARQYVGKQVNDMLVNPEHWQEEEL